MDQVADRDERLDAHCQMYMGICAAETVQVCTLDAAAFRRQFRVGERFEISGEQRQIALGMPVEVQIYLMINVAAHRTGSGSKTG